MLLADLAQWREHNIAAQLLKTAACLNEAVPYGNQCFLNTVFQKNWLQLEESWNFQTGAVEYFQKRNLGEVFPKPDTVPPVIHYTTRAKPWLCDYSEIPFTEVYWQYYCADWPKA